MFDMYLQAAANVRFDWADLNKNGVVEYDEWTEAFPLLESDVIKVSFSYYLSNVNYVFSVLSCSEWYSFVYCFWLH